MYYILAIVFSLGNKNLAGEQLGLTWPDQAIACQVFITMTVNLPISEFLLFLMRSPLFFN